MNPTKRKIRRLLRRLNVRINTFTHMEDYRAESRLHFYWLTNYYGKLIRAQYDYYASDRMQQEAYTDLLYKTFPYLSRTNPYKDD